MVCMNKSNRWNTYLEKYQVGHCVSRWIDLAYIWINWQAVLQRRELSEQIEHLNNYDRFLQGLGFADGVILSTVAIGTIVAVLSCHCPKQ